MINYFSNSDQSSFLLLIKLWEHINAKRRLQLVSLLILMSISGIAELASLGTVIPFLAVLSNPSTIWNNSFVQKISLLFGLTSPQQLILPTCIIFAFSAILASTVRLLNLRANGFFAAAVASDLSYESYRRTLYQPYEVHLKRNSSSIINTITFQTNRTVVALNSLLQIFTAVNVSAALLIGLILINSFIAIVAALIFGTAYVFLGYTSRKELQSNGKRIASLSDNVIKSLQEGLGSIRDVLLDNTQMFYLNNYQEADRPQRKLQAINAFNISLPRYILEALGMVFIAFIGCYVVLQTDNQKFDALPFLGAMALGAQRLLPSIQQIYQGWASIKSCNASLEGVLKMLNQPIDTELGSLIPISFKNNIVFHKVVFKYTSQDKPVIKNLCFKIQFGECIGFIGTTGSGKTTTVDLLMGLLSPSSGQILIDGLDLHDKNQLGRVISWRSNIAHVPQNIFLSDCSIAENIAFGVPASEIDMDKVRLSAKQAQISSFIDSTNEGYGLFVGERGSRLSGGQKQRIGIARALYKNAKLLVFDEATSALDNKTEKSLIDSINQLNKELTIVMVAHRTSSLEYCDRIIHLQDGAILSDS